MDSARLERQRALARERQRRRRANSAVRAKESAAKRQRREANPEVRKKATEAKRRQRQANPELHRQKATEAQRRRRQANPALIRKDTEARRLRMQANPELRKKAAQAKRQLRKGNPELRKKETLGKRTWRQALAEGVGGRFERDVYDLAAKCVCIPYPLFQHVSRCVGVAFSHRGSWLLKSSSAAEHASSITWASRLAGKSSSLSQCGVPAESKTSQADFKPKSRGVGVQTQQERRIPANSVHKKSAGTSAVHRSRPEAADVALRLWEELQSRQQATAPSLE
ncbi:uncharacterized protein LOC144145878 isoform X1 [Haemaphysalis longicornis]